MNRTRICLALLVIFAAGVVAGHVVTKQALTPDRPHRAGDRSMADNIVGKLSEELELSDTQTRQLKPLINDFTTELKRIRGESLRCTWDAIEALDDRINPILNEDQQLKLKAFRRNEEKYFKSRSEKTTHNTSSNAPSKGGSQEPANTKPSSNQ